MKISTCSEFSELFDIGDDESVLTCFLVTAKKYKWWRMEKTPSKTPSFVSIFQASLFSKTSDTLVLPPVLLIKPADLGL